MISSPDVNKLLRRQLSPILRDSGFHKVEARKAWSWQGPATWVFEIRSVGSYFSDVTGWPPMSLTAWLGVYYQFISDEWHPEAKPDKTGRLVPREWECHFRSHLEATLDQSCFQDSLGNPGDRKRRDIWWIERDGINVSTVVENIAWSFVEQGRPWYAEHANLELAFARIEQEGDCYNKFYRAVGFARHLGEKAKERYYADLLQQEAERIDGILSPKAKSKRRNRS